ncbi:helix-turn-helix domain-containing protein [Clostridium massiliodielmoense]|uniref:helix-turn-helix domain-containing protein n=1 Tax=Clostridium massiliodielmoense TaxID=1776385 RepID=UPI000A26BA78|nr:XRE family transcriptional regulator [Clostridium massiliodielmoense]
MKSLIKNKQKIIPSRIREARIVRGLSLAELADRVGVTSQAISQYELGVIKPTPLVINAIVRELGFPIRFYEKPYIYKSEDYSNTITYFRSNKNSSKKIKRALSKKIEILHEILGFLTQYVDIPKPDIPDYSEFIGDKELDEHIIQDIAIDLRIKWGVKKGPINNMITLFQDKGIIISRMEFENKKIDAFSQIFQLIPYIFLGSDKECSVRSRFDLAHELGHLILHRNVSEEDVKNKEFYSKMEKQADLFAGEFLLPYDEFDNDIISTSIEQFIMLKNKWKVSIQCMIKRCEQLDILSDNQLRYIKSQMTKKRYWRREPLDDEIKIEQPYLFKQIFQLLIENDILRPEEIVDEIGLYKEEIDSLCYLPEDLLKNSLNVVPLKLKLIK